MTQFYTYIYRDPSRLNSKGFPEEIYVGKGKGKRAYEHLKRTDNHPFVTRLKHLRKLGVKPIIEIFQALDEDHAFFLESCLVDCIGRKDLGKGSLLNLSDGGKGGTTGWVASPEYRKKRSESVLARGQDWRDKLSASSKVWQQSPEAKAMHAANTKRTHSDPAIVASKSEKMKAYHAARRAGEIVGYSCANCNKIFKNEKYLKNGHEQACLGAKQEETVWTESTLLSW